MGKLLDRGAARRELAEFLWVCVESRGVLVLDKAFLKEKRLSRSRALMALCELLLAERVHLRSDREGCVVAMSNFEFMRFILNRAGQEFAPRVVPEENDMEWFAIEVAADLPDDFGIGIDFPDERQALPERRRDPWIVSDGIETEYIKKSETV